MNDMTRKDLEDLEACAKEGRRPRDHGPYRVQVGDAMFRFETIVAESPISNGRALLELAALTPAQEYILFAHLTDGLLEEIRLDETVDLREGVEKFLAFRSDRIFRLLINGRDYQWGAPFISGATILMLAKSGGGEGVWLRDGGADRQITLRELVDLGQPGVEAFVTRSRVG